MKGERVDKLLLDVLYQACGSQICKANNGIVKYEIDNCCLKAYEEACRYLAKRGYLKSNNGRIYTLLTNTRRLLSSDKILQDSTSEMSFDKNK